MGVLDRPKVDKIKQLLKFHPNGMTISDLSKRMKINRNLVAHSLDMLLISGHVEYRSIGPAKLYFLSHRVPISAMIEFSSDKIIILDEKNLILEVNEPFLNLLNVRKETLIGKNLHEVENPLTRQLSIIEQAEDLHANPGKITDIKSMVQGEARSFRIKGIPIVLENGGQGVTYIIKDIPEQVKYQELLETSDGKCYGIIEDQKTFITLSLLEDSLIFVNPAYARYLGKEPGQLISGPRIPNLHEEDRILVENVIQSLNHHQPVKTFECRIVDPSGNILWSQWTARVIFDESGTPIIQVTGHYISREKEYAEKERDYKKNLEFLTRTAMEFVEMGDEEDIYRYVTCKVYELVPHSVVGINSYDPVSRTLTMRYVKGDAKDIDYMIREMGISLIGLVFPFHDRADAEYAFSQKSLVRGPELYDLFFRIVPKEICDRVCKELNFGKSYVMGFSRRGKIFGNIGIQLKKGMELGSKETIEAFIGQASVALLKRQTSEDR
jgi:PAS domain S-box-containing protein